MSRTQSGSLVKDTPHGKTPYNPPSLRGETPKYYGHSLWSILWTTPGRARLLGPLTRGLSLRKRKWVLHSQPWPPSPSRKGSSVPGPRTQEWAAALTQEFWVEWQAQPPHDLKVAAGSLHSAFSSTPAHQTRWGPPLEMSGSKRQACHDQYLGSVNRQPRSTSHLRRACSNITESTVNTLKKGRKAQKKQTFLEREEIFF